MSNNTVNVFSIKFDEIVTEKKAKLRFPEFHRLYCELCGKTIDESESQLIFRGLDLKGSGFITKDTFLNMVRNLVSNDGIYVYKLIFRAFSNSRSKNLVNKDLLEIFKYCGRDHATIKHAEDTMMRRTGDKNGKMNFAIFYNELTGKDVPPNTDPYDC